MSITYQRASNLFKLTTANTLYAFELSHGMLVHRYYGNIESAKGKNTAIYLQNSLFFKMRNLSL